MPPAISLFPPSAQLAGFRAPGARRPARRSLWPCLWLALALAGSRLAAAETAVAPEYNVKAGFLVAFVQYTTWPESVFDSAEAPVVIGIWGANPFGEVLVRTAQRQLSGRHIEVRNIHTPDEAARCQVVFISKLARENEADWLATLRGRPVLTVGESGQTLQRGGLVEFVVVDKKIRFDVSRPAMELAGLRSAPIFQSARTVYHAEPRAP